MLIQVFKTRPAHTEESRKEFQAQLWTIVWRGHKDRCQVLRAGVRE